MNDLFNVEEQINENEKLKRIKMLESLITKYQDSYYNGEAEISDAEFDKLWDELKSLFPESSVLKRIGKDSVSFEKTKHVMPMGSQEKAANPEQFKAWAYKHFYDEYLVEYKLDGASLELQYEKGVLKVAVTRGDGSVGDNITSNAKKMSGVLHTLPSNFTGGVRGEVIMTREIHKQKYRDKANCRNAANGIMKRKDGKGSGDLTFIAYDALSTTSENFFSDEEEKINWLSSSGFNTVPLQICKTIDDVISYRASVMEKRKTLSYDIDGLVVKERVINLDDAARARPDRQIAFKFSLEEAVSILREVEWSISGGTYTPVAIFDPVELAGTTVQRASLSNPDVMRSLDVKIGSKVVVVKRGEIIPKIESVLENDATTSPVVFPEQCEVCGTTLLDEGSRLFCPNKNCEKRVLHQILKWVNVVDIRDLGETLVTSLFQKNVIRSISDIYLLREETLIPFFLNEESISKDKKSLGAKKVLSSISSKTILDLPTFIAGFDIEGIGKTMAEKLVSSGYNSLQKILSATEDDFVKVDGFAEKLAKIAVDGLRENSSEMNNLISKKIITLQENSGGVLEGKSFCFTGELKSMKRSDAEKIVKENGGSCKSSVTKDLSFLVTNDKESGSSKNEKALKFGIPVINEEEFFAMIKN